NWSGTVQGIDNLQAQYAAQYGPGSYMPIIPLTYWSFRAMIGFGMLAALIAVVAWWSLRRDGGRLRPGRARARVRAALPHGPPAPPGGPAALGRDRAAVPAAARERHRVDHDRGRPPAMARLRAAQDRRRRLAQLSGRGPRLADHLHRALRGPRCDRGQADVHLHPQGP